MHTTSRFPKPMPHRCRTPAICTCAGWGRAWLQCQQHIPCCCVSGPCSSWCAAARPAVRVAPPRFRNQTPHRSTMASGRGRYAQRTRTSRAGHLHTISGMQSSIGLRTWAVEELLLLLGGIPSAPTLASLFQFRPLVAFCRIEHAVKLRRQERGSCHATVSPLQRFASFVRCAKCSKVRTRRHVGRWWTERSSS